MGRCRDSAGDLEIDLDLENDEHVYLWGARLTEVPAHWPEKRGGYVHFSSFDPLDADGEVQLAIDLWNWLTDLRERANADGLTVRIYGYHAGPVEGAALRRLVPSDELEALLASDEWVDLLPYMRRKFWSNEGSRTEGDGRCLRVRMARRRSGRVRQHAVVPQRAGRCRP